MACFQDTAKTLSCDIETKGLNLNCVIFWYTIFHEPSLAAAMDIQKWLFKLSHRSNKTINSVSLEKIYSKQIICLLSDTNLEIFRNLVRQFICYGNECGLITENGRVHRKNTLWGRRVIEK